MNSDTTRRDLLGWFRQRLDALVSDETDARKGLEPPPDDRPGSKEGERLRGIIAALKSLPAGITLRGRLGHTPREEKPTERLTAVIQSTAEAAQHYAENDWPEASELCLLVHDTCLLLTAEKRPPDQPDVGIFWNWQDSVRRSLAAKEYATDEVLERHVDFSTSLWEVFASAHLLGLPGWAAFTARHFLSACEDALKLAARLNRLKTLTSLRGLYTAAWRHAASRESDERGPRSAGPLHLWAELGREVGRMHAQAEDLISPRPAGSKGWLWRRNHHSGVATVLPSMAGRLFDIDILFRGETDYEAEDFLRGYFASQREGKKTPLTFADLAKASQGRRPTEHYGVEAPDDEPPFEVRLCTYALRDSEEVSRSLEERLDALSQAARGATRAISAAVLACDSKGVREDVAGEATGIFYKDINHLFREQRFEDLERAARRGLLFVRYILSSSASVMVEALLDLSRAQTEASPEAEMAHRFSACELLAQSYFPESLGFCREELLALADNQGFANRHGEVVGLMIAVSLRSLRLEGRPEVPLELAGFLQRNVRAEHLSGAELSAVEACKVALTGLMRPDGAVTLAELDRAIEAAAGHDVLNDLVVILLSLRPPDDAAKHCLFEGSGGLKTGIRFETYNSLLTENWPAAAAYAKRDLASLGDGKSTEGLRLLLVGYIGLALRKLSEVSPASASYYADEALSLLDEYADAFASSAPPAEAEGADAWAASASNLALAAVFLFPASGRGRPYPSRALELLALTISVTPIKLRPLEHATYLHDLAHAYRQFAAHVSPAERFGYYEKSAALFRESLVIYRNLREQPRFRAALRDRPEHIDYFNLGRTYLELSQLATPSVSTAVGPYASPLYLRAALCVLAVARDIASEKGYDNEATYARLLLAQLGKELALACLEHTRANRGTLRREFHDWLCVIEGPVLSTWDFATRYASFALRESVDALVTAARSGDRSLLSQCLQVLFSAWKVAEMRHGVSGARILFDDNWSNMEGFRNGALVTITETLDGLAAALAEDAEWGEVSDELDEYRRYFTGRIHAAMFERLGGRGEDLQAAEAHFSWLKDNGNVISRALTRPLANWFHAAAVPGGVAFNGLFIGGGREGLELRVLSLRQAFEIGGLRVRGLTLETWPSSWIKTNSTSAVAAALPQVDWSQVPAFVPVVAAVCESGENKVALLAVRLPTVSWDTWVLHLKTVDAGVLEFRLPPSLRLAGEEGESSAPSGNEGREAQAGPLVFDVDGLVVEVSLHGVAPDRPATLSAVRDTNGTLIRAEGAELTISLRTTPGIVDADIVSLVKTDDSAAASSCAATFPLITPQTNLPSELMRAFSPLFFFATHLDDKAARYVAGSPHRQVVLVGLPDTLEQTGQILLETFDPRRDFYLLLSREEVPRALAALEQFREQVSRMAGAPLFEVAASIDEDLDAFAHLQVVEVERSLAPAAAQMLLDITAHRRLPLEDIPHGGSGGPYPFQILGDLGAMRRAITALPNPATWDELVEKYVELGHEVPLESFGSTESEGIRAYMEAFSRPIQKRPHIIAPRDGALLLACVPYARHLGAFLLPDTKAARLFIEQTDASDVYSVEGCRHLPAGRAVVTLPGTYAELAARFSEVAGRDHETRVRSLTALQSADAPSARLAARMQPNRYAVVSGVSGAEYWAAALAANYAGALGSPLLLFDDESLFSDDELRKVRRATAFDPALLRSSEPASRDLRPYKAPEPLRPTSARVAELNRVISALEPQYVGVVSNRLTIPLEYLGEPPLATRYAIGRLCAPDLTSLSLLMTAAALMEEVQRESHVRVLIAEASDAVEDKFLPGARAEASHLRELLSQTADVVVTESAGENDLATFVGAATTAHIIHFSGHGSFDAQCPTESSIIFRGGRLRAADVPQRLAGFPIVFSNACETGIAYDIEEAGRGWSGLAAAFIEAGAVNYIGSLWPVFDESSRRLAEEFYSLLNLGHSSGEALRRAKLTAYSAGDSTWAAMVLFGCPRNKLRAGIASL